MIHQMQVDFIKMHGLGNDFVIIDNRQQEISFTPELIKRYADRKTGIGCDQWIVIEKSDQAYATMLIFNAGDGLPVEACGNASRCVGSLLMQEAGQEHVALETPAGLISCEKISENYIKTDLGEVKLDWQDIPLAQEVDTKAIPLGVDGLDVGYAVNIGNPHLVFLVDELDLEFMQKHGNRLIAHWLFPNKTNVEMVKIHNEQLIEMLVCERGVGLTKACGTGACAAMVAAHLSGQIERKAKVMMQGGALEIEWLENNHIAMTGHIAESFRGQFFLEGA